LKVKDVIRLAVSGLIIDSSNSSLMGDKSLFKSNNLYKEIKIAQLVTIKKSCFNYSTGQKYITFIFFNDNLIQSIYI